MATSGRSRGSKAARQAIDRPFAPEILRQAKALAQRYQIVLELEDDWWYGHGLELPGAGGDGKTPQEAVSDTREALTAVVAYLLEKGQRPPAPAAEGRRGEQVNIRLTAEERALLESRSRAAGFRGLSDFVRAAVLAESADRTILPARRPRKRHEGRKPSGKVIAKRS